MVRDQYEANDLAQEAFYMVFRAIKDGHGPNDSFFGYVLSTVRRLAFRFTNSRSRVWVTDDLASCEPSTTSRELGPTQLDDVASAWAGLPERWRQILWLIEVDGYSPAELALRLGMSSTAVSSLATRARDALRTGFLAQQVFDDDQRCTKFIPRLAAYVRGTLASRWIPSLTKHIEVCATCQECLSQLAEHGARLGLAPAATTHRKRASA